MRSKRILGIAAAAAVFAGSLMQIPAAAESSGPPVISAENSAHIEDAINDLITANAGTTPSVTVTVFDSEKDICNVTYGMADMEKNVPADEDTVYEWGSVSKLLVWTSAMQLYEQGRLDLNADISTYLPQGFMDFLTYDEPVTMLDLMNHSAGFLSPHSDMETENIEDIMPLDKALAEIAPAQQTRPGESTAYSNFGAALAGYVVQCVSGMDFADYVKENIFQRLGMEHTALRPDLSDNPRVAEGRKNISCYAQGEEGLASLGECRRYIHIYPAGGACGTVSDMAIFARAFLAESKDCPLFDEEGTLDEMLSPTLYYAGGKAPRFCHGFMTDTVGVQLLGHGGNTEGFSSLLQIDPVGKTGFVMMTNKQLDRTYKGELPKLLYGAADHSAIAEEGFAPQDLSGHYKMTGGMYDRGCFKAVSLFSDIFTVSGSEGGYTGTRGVTSLKQISSNALLVKLVTGSEYEYYIRSENGKVTALENGSLDFIKISSAEYYLGCGALIAMLIGIALMILPTVPHAIRLRNFKGSGEYGFKKCELLINVFSLGLALCICLLFTLGLGLARAKTAACVGIIIFTLAIVLGEINCIRLKPKGAFTVAAVTECLCAAFIVIGVIYWQLYCFWIR